MQLNDLLSLGQHRIWKRMAVSWSGLVFKFVPLFCFVEFLFTKHWNRAKTGDSLLDLCCGSGDLTFLMSEKAGADGKVCLFWIVFHHCYSLLSFRVLYQNINNIWGAKFVGNWPRFLERTTINCFITPILAFKGLLQ